MNTSKLQTILGYLNIGLAIAHDSGVTLGHFGATDFITLAESVNSLLLSAFEPATGASTAASSNAVGAASSRSAGSGSGSSTASSGTDSVATGTALVAVS